MASASEDGASAEPIERGTAVGRYIVLSAVGRGGMGTVYAAFDPDLDRRVALKILPLAQGRSVTELGREARSLAKLAHPHVASVFDVGVTDTVLYIAMELVDGDLVRWLRAGSRSVSEIVEVFVDAGRGLAAAHDKGLVHGDFKPSNVLIGSDGRVRVADFGLARLADDLPSLSAGDGRRSLASSRGTYGGGTPGFMAPEILAGDPPDASADQYALCVSLVWSLTDSMPDELADVELSLAERGVRREHRRAIARGLAARPTDRFETVDELLAVLAARPARRRALVAALGLGLLGGGALTWSLARPSTAAIDRCAAGREALASAWNEEHAQAVSGALADADGPFAAGAAERVRARLDAYAHAWSRAHRGLCAAPERTVEHEARLRCLDARLVELQALRSALSEPGGAATAGAASAVASLRPAESCTDPGWRPPPASLEPPPSLAPQVAALRPTLELGAAYEVTGQFDRALEILQEVAPRVQALGHAPLLAEARYHTGMVMMEQGRADEAEPVLYDAFATALGCGHDEIMIQSASLLVFANKDDRDDMDEAAVWETLAKAAVDRVGPNSDQESTYWKSTGILAQRRGDYDRAREAYERAVALDREHLPADHPAVPVALSMLASLDAEQRRYVDAERRAREVLALRSALLGPDHPDLIVDHVTLASALTPQGKPDEAIEHLRRAHALGLSNLAPGHPRRLGVDNNLAAALNARGETESARALYAEVLEARIRDPGPRDPLTGLAHNNLASTLYRLGRLDEAVEHYQAAVKISTAAFGPGHERVVLALNGLAATLVESDRCDEAHTAIEGAWTIVAAAEQDDGASHPPLMPFVANTRAVVRLCQGDGAGALADSRRAVELARSVPGEPSTALPRLLVTLARAELASDRHQAAEATAQQALERLGDGPSLSRARAELVLAEVARSQGDAPEARARAQRALLQLTPDDPRSVPLRERIAVLTAG